MPCSILPVLYPQLLATKEITSRHTVGLSWLRINLQYVSTSLPSWYTVTGTIVVKLGNALRRTGRCTWRHMEGLLHVQRTAIRSPRSPSRTGGSVKAGVHG